MDIRKTGSSLIVLILVSVTLLLVGCTNPQPTASPTVPSVIPSTASPATSSPVLSALASSSSSSVTATSTQSPVKTSITPVSTKDIDLAYIQVSTGKTPGTTDLIYHGIAVKLSCYDSKNQIISLNGISTKLEIGLYDSSNKPGNNWIYNLEISYLPKGSMDDILWLYLRNFIPGNDSSYDPYPYRKFEGNVKVILKLPDHQPLEAIAPVKLYLNDFQQVPAAEYYDYETKHGTPPPTTIYNNDYDDFTSPQNGETITSTCPTFVWDVFVQNDSFNIKIASDPQFTNIIDSQTGVSNIYKLKEPLKKGKMYFWEIQAVRGNIKGKWAANTFTVE